MEIKRTDKKKNKSILKSTITLLIIISAALLFTRVVVSNILATSGQRLAAANLETKVLQEENQKLENIISQLNSLKRVEKLAQKKGFVKVKNVEILVTSGPIAKR
ncbi:hypothetical protein IH981_00840 [Patescibacteria group bacterium]|nr:hypothetical protein [Patescibacteria group bacterium]